MTGQERTGRLLDRPVLDLDAAEARLRRALEQRDDWRYELHPDGGATCRNFRTGREYELDAVSGCTCPDAAFRGVVCKHQVGLRLLRLERGLP